jgi:hypothetical protein
MGFNNEAQQAERVAKEYSAVADYYHDKDPSRWLDATRRALAWQAYADIVATLPPRPDINTG